MNRMGQLAFAATSLVLILSPGWADGTSPDNEDSRFSFYRTPDGFLRLDGTSGAVSMCARRPAGWLCQALPEERAALEAAITRLQSDVVALKKELLAHNVPLPAGMRAEPAPTSDDKSWLRPDDLDVDHVMSKIGNVWRRLVEMIEFVQKDLRKKS